MAAQVEQTLHFDEGQQTTCDLRVLQSLDLLTQTLADLARFTAAAAPLLPMTALPLAPAIETLTLRAIADRLSGADDASQDLASGDLSLF